MSDYNITLTECLSQVAVLSKENARLRKQHQTAHDDLEMWIERYAVLRRRADEMFDLLQQAQKIDKGDMSLNIDTWMREVKELVGVYYED
jgi:hypothetical protein